MKIVILGSGEGTNCKAILDASNSGLLGDIEITAVCSDNSNSGILEIAKQAAIPHSYLGSYNPTDAIDSNRWIDEIKKYSPDLIVLAGFMKILNSEFIKSFNSQIINLHPSLLPSFRGLHAIKQAWDAGVKITGCTVHWVTPLLDCGPIIAQAPVRVMPSDSLDSITAKVKAVEHMLLPSVIGELALSFQSND